MLLSAPCFFALIFFFFSFSSPRFSLVSSSNPSVLSVTVWERGEPCGSARLSKPVSSLAGIRLLPELCVSFYWIACDRKLCGRTCVVDGECLCGPLRTCVCVYSAQTHAHTLTNEVPSDGATGTADSGYITRLSWPRTFAAVPSNRLHCSSIITPAAIRCGQPNVKVCGPLDV